MGRSEMTNLTTSHPSYVLRWQVYLWRGSSILANRVSADYRKEKRRRLGLRATPYVGTPIPIPGALLNFWGVRTIKEYHSQESQVAVSKV